MTRYDLSPLFRSSVGFDHLSHLLDTAFKVDERAPSYPPYNIAKLSDDEYEITMAVSGFKPEELNVVVQQNTLTVTGNVKKETEENGKTYLHKGIANRSFERKFSLADHVKAVEAQLTDGLLTLRLKREIPESSKPRSIPISISGGSLIEGKVDPKKKAA
ncbi:MAG: Hsp20 family protein [Rickettsiales bacterium]|nr:Hsp20 family protein [Rickettsiales bacterium]